MINANFSIVSAKFLTEQGNVDALWYFQVDFRKNVLDKIDPKSKLSG